MHFTRSSAVAVLAAAVPAAFAQTSTTCQPLNGTCPSDPGLNSATFSADFTQGPSQMASFSLAEGTTLAYGSNGAQFMIGQAGQAPTISSDFYFLFGRVDVKMRASNGQGIVSSIVLESDDLDEIDWEFLGGDTTQVQSNFFGKGNHTTYNRVEAISVASPQSEFHTYSFDWNADRLQWLIDGTVVRTVPYSDPLALGGKNYPQTPMRLKLGNWCGGCAGEPEGTVSWAGGATTFGSSPYVMYVESVAITNNNPASSYTYGDTSGDWQSIKINGDSSVAGTSSLSATTSAVPTASVSVGAVSNTEVAASTTHTASSYSMNSASISAQNGGTTFATAATTVPGQSSATLGATTTAATPSATFAMTGGAASTAALTGASLLSFAVAFFLL